MPFLRLFIFSFLLLPVTSHADNNLPIFGDTTSGIISLSKEHELGQAWARSLRGSAKLLDDPITYSYLNDLLWKLASHSQLQDRRLDLIVLDNPTLNAFAVPGGIIGIHGGLILSADNEDELASVVAHELAHLSQRHFASQLEEARRNRPFTLAALLASILVASADGQAGAAAISTTIASQQSAALAFSRQNEQEADRVGMQTLVNAGIDPEAMPRMFSRLLRSQRFDQNRLPEFLLTHPVSESRIADALNRSAQLPDQPASKNSKEYEIIRTRMTVHFAKSPQDSYAFYRQAVDASPTPTALYGLALSSIETNRYQEAHQALKQLPNDWQSMLYIKLTVAEIYLAQQNWQTAVESLQALNELYPYTYTVEKLLSKALMAQGQPAQAIRVMNNIKRDYPKDVDNWYLLAEAYGQNNERMNVHLTRIEYFLLTGQTDRANQQITFARREKNQSQYEIARLDQLEQETKAVRDAMKMDI
ncbi:M48 family metalloprotease [Neptunomonas phycophila]|jgi:predicted Zn-dependent protease|uniref:M48 family metalloprotease n=2 Tax=Neptunomonas phycophila TaxID=1572645 RepID=UPI000948BF4D|nr:M48 family metalloprotease [Neptunomonas phycophila]MDO6469613.1 M48 family metalloprotease [Neptunomonas phycophila]